MRVLLTNDDGIHSLGLWAIAKSLEEIADLTVVVPDRDQSGKGASMTLLRPLTVEKIDTPKNMKTITSILLKSQLKKAQFTALLILMS